MATTTKAREAENGASPAVDEPYTLDLTLRGTRPFLFNQFDAEAYLETGPTKERRVRPERDYERMVWRDEEGMIAIPALNVLSSIAHAGRYFRSPLGSTGSAKATLQEGLVTMGEFASFMVETWDSIDFRMARNSDQKRSPRPTWRPRLEPGWSCKVSIAVTTPELYGPATMLEIASKAGIVCGIGDGRKIGMGRFVLDGTHVTDGIQW